jgi:hypothetical protein
LQGKIEGQVKASYNIEAFTSPACNVERQMATLKSSQAQQHVILHPELGLLERFNEPIP